MPRTLWLASVIAFALSPAGAAPEPEKGWGEAFVDLLGRRQVQSQRLQEYSLYGVFPTNKDFPEKTPYFVDAKGTPCAVANLMVEDGQKDLVQAIAKKNNQVRVKDVKDGPLIDWILRSGLTQEECARIQPTYGPQTPEEIARNKERERIRKHFETVLHELQEHTYTSLSTAMDRLEPVLRKELPAHTGFLLQKLFKHGEGALTDKSLATNRWTGAVQTRVLYIPLEGESTPWQGPWTILQPGQTLDLGVRGYPQGGPVLETAILMEWKAEKEPGSPPLKLAVEKLPKN